MQVSSADSDAKYSSTMYKCVNSDYIEAQQYLDKTCCHGNAVNRLRHLNTALSKTRDDLGTLLLSVTTCKYLFCWILTRRDLFLSRQLLSLGRRTSAGPTDGRRCGPHQRLAWIENEAEHREVRTRCRAWWRFFGRPGQNRTCLRGFHLCSKRETNWTWAWWWCPISSPCCHGGNQMET